MDNGWTRSPHRRLAHPARGCLRHRGPSIAIPPKRVRLDDPVLDLPTMLLSTTRFRSRSGLVATAMSIPPPDNHQGMQRRPWTVETVLRRQDSPPDRRWSRPPLTWASLWPARYWTCTARGCHERRTQAGAERSPRPEIGGRAPTQPLVGDGGDTPTPLAAVGRRTVLIGAPRSLSGRRSSAPHAAPGSAPSARFPYRGEDPRSGPLTAGPPIRRSSCSAP
jgi:hypothetical protein